MAFYKKFQSKLNDLWYPRAITTGIPITTDRIADKLSCSLPLPGEIRMLCLKTWEV